jgi:hypothetical protein
MDMESGLKQKVEDLLKQTLSHPFITCQSYDIYNETPELYENSDPSTLTISKVEYEQLRVKGNVMNCASLSLTQLLQLREQFLNK